ncbi:hypothetical protein NH340_JMT07943 [Sarcoptes scabiei]|nr:hypothetical protein NH340_JMT07943 [Sarcoptes scabiei]
MDGIDSQLVWVPDPQKGYVLGRVLEIGGNNIALIRLESNNGLIKDEKIECPIENVFPAELDQQKDYDDNCSLMFLNEGNLLHNIRLRYSKNKIYTYVANILIALNPYCDLREQYYSTKILRSYQGKSLGKMSPHVFAIADKAYFDIKRMEQSQSIIVSGESGAGKTESTKYILRYICESYGETQSDNAIKIEQLILEANPLLEAFGNAKTVRNNNSSRFGKFIEIFINRQSMVAGGHISHYLLEKSRVCGISSPLERNYHIFYQLCVGLPEQQWLDLCLKPPDQFFYLNKGCTRYFLTSKEDQKLSVDRKSKQHLKEGYLSDSIVNDLAEYHAMESAFKHFGVSEEDKIIIFKIVAAILHLGNISFEESPNDSHGGCRVREDCPESKQALKIAAKLLGVDVDELQKCLKTRIMQTNKGGYKGSIYMVPLKVHEAQNARDALAKAIYSRLFDYIVSKIINKALPMVATTVINRNDGTITNTLNHSIGVLDIAGFEYFQSNSFEQFCINYCNEKLQNFFNERIFNDEQQLYEIEGLGLKRIDYVDNHDCIDLLETKGYGIFDLLDEECRLPKPSSHHFTENVFHKNRGKFRLDIPRKSKLKIYRELRDDEGFIIKHFAGAVCYQTSEFIEKNNDSLHTNLAFLMLESSNPILKSFFQQLETCQSTAANHNLTQLSVPNNLADKSVRLSLESVGSKFRKQLDDLMRKLQSTSTHFVRCIKPNLTMVAKNFDGSCILSQLKCSGMTSVLDLMQNGYPSRASYSHIYNLYSPRLPKQLSKIDARFFSNALIKAVGLDDSDVRFGVTKVFFRPGRFAEFDLLMKNDDPEASDRLVKKVQHWLIASRWRRSQWCSLSVIKLKNKILYRRNCIIIIQKYFRMFLARKRFQPHYESIKLINKTKEHVARIKPLIDKIQTESDRQKYQTDLVGLNRLIEEIPSRAKIIVHDMMLFDQKKVNQIIETISSKIDALVRELEKILNEQEIRLKRIQESLEAERLKKIELENQQKEQEKLRKRKAELERRKKSEMINEKNDQNLNETNKTNPFQQMNEEERKKQIEFLKRLEQERRDYELAVRLSQDGQHFIQQQDDFVQQFTTLDNVKRQLLYPDPSPSSNASSKRYKLESWNYAKLRDTINTSNDIELLEACREEFHRRLKVYHQWKFRINSSRSSSVASTSTNDSMMRKSSSILNQTQTNKVSNQIDSRAPNSVINPFYSADHNLMSSVTDRLGGDKKSNQQYLKQQRFFRLPFDRHGGQSKGIWYAHFDGKWIARQMEIHPEKQAILLVAGKDDLKMCELSLEETGLTKKRGAEILPEEFEAVWSSNGGQLCL